MLNGGYGTVRCGWVGYGLAFQEKYQQLTELALVFTAIAEVVKSGV